MTKSVVLLRPVPQQNHPKNDENGIVCLMRHSMNKRDLMIVAAIVMTGFCIAGNSIFTPCLSSVYEEVPGGNDSLNAFVVTGPAMVGTIGILLMGILGQRIERKRLIIMFMVAAVIGGSAICFARNMLGLAALRVVNVASFTINNALVQTYIAELYRSDPKRRSYVEGMYLGLGSGYSTLMSLIAGVVAVHSWRIAQLLNLIPVMGIYFVIRYAPEVRQKEGSAADLLIGDADAQKQYAVGASEKGNMPQYFALMCSNFSFDMIVHIAYFFCDVYIAQCMLGNAALSGFLGAVTYGMITATTLLFGEIYKRTGRHTVVIMRVLTLVSLLLLWVKPTVMAVTLAMAINGITIGIDMAYYPVKVIEYIPQKQITFLMSVFFIGNTLGQSLCAFLPVWIMEATKATTYREIFGYLAAVSTVLLVVSACVAYAPKKPSKKT